MLVSPLLGGVRAYNGKFGVAFWYVVSGEGGVVSKVEIRRGGSGRVERDVEGDSTQFCVIHVLLTHTTQFYRRLGL